ncbi:MAG: FKBP-type peptidyl-prolyl cis-trans isomerase [Hydrotalea sp.]|nr:FKBP-type peptidyl-prolyl cis-trans isomerase [Hydrotalea sp.]
MKRLLLIVLVFVFSAECSQAQVDTAFSWQIPDSVRGSQVLVQWKASKFNKWEMEVKLHDFEFELKSEKGQLKVEVDLEKSHQLVSAGWKVKAAKNKLNWPIPDSLSAPSQLSISVVPDTSIKQTLYSTYLFFPSLGRWKWIGSFLHKEESSWVKKLEVDWENASENLADLALEAWVQRPNGSWKNLTSKAMPQLVPVTKHVDSLAFQMRDRNLLNRAIRKRQIDTTGTIEGVYYYHLAKGNGNPVNVTDSVTVHYKGSLFSDGSVFDATKDKPATFPLNRLIRGWQLAVPTNSVGGKTRIYIPSEQAYSIRSRSFKIPPASILVFDVEVLAAKPSLSR